jgi:hypothetical protein
MDQWDLDDDEVSDWLMQATELSLAEIWSYEGDEVWNDYLTPTESVLTVTSVEALAGRAAKPPEGSTPRD